jgi:energy-coupling factor transporter transmembrane protein EcfT
MKVYIKWICKILKILILGLITLFFSVWLFYKIFIVESCDEMSNVYFEWFPYNEKDILLFVNENNIQKKVSVKRFEISHTDEYLKLTKCGRCEDYIEILFCIENDSLKIRFENFDNPKSYFGSDSSIKNYADIENYFIDKDTLINGKKYECIQTKNHTFIKSLGLVEINLKGDKYRFHKRIKQTNKKNIKNGCGC